MLAHEFGHYLGLPHTFEDSGGAAFLRCNDIYPVAVECNSCQGNLDAAAEVCDATYNVMDYCSGDNNDVRLNACQREKSANQRERYLTNDGATNYFKMKGRLGEPYCVNDGECLDDEYCNTGVATVGRNVCKPKLSDGATCSRSGQCDSGNCSLFTCR